MNGFVDRYEVKILMHFTREDRNSFKFGDQLLLEEGPVSDVVELWGLVERHGLAH